MKTGHVRCLASGPVKICMAVLRRQFGVHLFIFIYLFLKFIYLFIYFWLRWVFVAACNLSLVAEATLRCSAQASHCGGFSCCGAQALGARASVFVAHGLRSCGLQALEHKLSSCGAWA